MQLIPKRYQARSTAGDTIVEVLIVLAVLSLAFAISLATANKGLGQSRNAEEHSQALGLLVSQVELLRTDVSSQITLPTDKPFCMTAANTSPTIITDPSNYPAACGPLQNFYYVSIQYDSSNNDYDLKVQWGGNGDLGQQQEEFNYRINPLTATASSGIPLTGSAPRVVVKVQEIPQDAGNSTPSCSKTPAAGSHSGIKIVLSGDSNQTAYTDNSGTATFTNGIVDGGTYKATIDPSNAPAGTLPHGYVLCGSPTSTAVTTLGNTKTIPFTIHTTCYQSGTTSGYYTPYGPSYPHLVPPPDPNEPYSTNTVTTHTYTYGWAHNGNGGAGYGYYFAPYPPGIPFFLEAYYPLPSQTLHYAPNAPNENGYQYIGPGPKGSFTTGYNTYTSYVATDTATTTITGYTYQDENYTAPQPTYGCY